MTEPLNPEQVADQIALAEVTFEDGKTVELTPRLDSACLIFDRFPAGGHLVQLRLDFSDPDDNGHPTLDADFLNPKTGKHLSVKGKPHRTESVSPTGPRAYEWVFKEVARRFTVGITWQVHGTAEACSSVSIASNGVRVLHPDGRRD